jgi:signal transduction histidine kinase
VLRIVDLEKRMPVTVQPSPQVKLVADSDQIEQLLINVIRNAVDASLETGGHVSVGWKRAGEWFELNVDDEGKGCRIRPICSCRSSRPNRTDRASGSP